MNTLRVERKQLWLNDAIEYLDGYLIRAGGDEKEALARLGSAELQFCQDEVGKCCDPYNGDRYYLENYHIVKTERGEAKTLCPFWEAQEIFFAKVQEVQISGKPVKILVIKARQLGLSTISQGLIFKKTIFNENCDTMVVAQDEDQSGYLFEKSRFAYENLPWWMRPQVRYESKGNYLVFDSEDKMRPGIKSSILVKPANTLTGVSVGKTLRGLHASELSLWANPSILTEQLFPAMNAPDLLAILESTARGRDNFLFKFWKEVVEGDLPDWSYVFIEFFRVKKYSMPVPKELKPLELSTEETALRDKVFTERNFLISDEQFYWRRYKMNEFIAINGDEYKFYQEYPGATWMEAFQGSGLCAFNKRKIHSILETTCVHPIWYGEIYYNTKSPKRPDLKGKYWKQGDHVPEQKEPGARLYIWEEPEPGETYYISVDVSGGQKGGDFSCCEVLRIGHMGQPDVQVAEWHGWINPTKLAYVAAALGYHYNEAQIAPECNDIGTKTQMELIRIIEYENLFQWKHYDKSKNQTTNYLGWWTNVKTRPLIITKASEYIDDAMVIIRSERLADQMTDFSSIEGSRFEGQQGNDDRVMAFMIGLWCAHDSDFGRDAAMAPKKEDKAEFFWSVVDQNNTVVGFNLPRAEAEAVLKQRAGLKLMRGQPKSDFANTDYSPIHDRPGIRQQAVYEHGVAPEMAHEYALYGPGAVSEAVANEEAWRMF